MSRHKATEKGLLIAEGNSVTIKATYLLSNKSGQVMIASLTVSLLL